MSPNADTKNRRSHGCVANGWPMAVFETCISDETVGGWNDGKADMFKNV